MAVTLIAVDFLFAYFSINMVRAPPYIKLLFFGLSIWLLPVMVQIAYEMVVNADLASPTDMLNMIDRVYAVTVYLAWILTAIILIYAAIEIVTRSLANKKMLEEGLLE